MRIRKRFHLLSSLTSDPQVINKPLVVQVQEQNGYSDLPYQPSDGQLTKEPTWVSQTDDLLSSSKNLVELEQVNDDERRMEQEDEEEKNKSCSNDIIIRKECILNEEVNISSLASFSSPFDRDRRWSGEGLVVPLKKRKRSFKISTEEDDSYSNTKWKSKTNKKSSLFQDDDNLQLLAKTTEVYVGDDIGNSSTRKTKNKKIRGSVILEGSRCSRMNGRGWRCGQPTLVGYSLCEHHLGKGRLRTMSSVTTRNQNQNRNQKQTMGTSTIAPKDDDEQTQELRTPSWIRGINREEIHVGTAKRNMEGKDVDDDEVSRVVVNKTRKLGKMRARSMSSLLVAIDNATLAASQQLPQKQ